jgi:hypothetical protein
MTVNSGRYDQRNRRFACEHGRGVPTLFKHLPVRFSEDETKQLRRRAQNSVKEPIWGPPNGGERARETQDAHLQSPGPLAKGGGMVVSAQGELRAEIVCRHFM